MARLSSSPLMKQLAIACFVSVISAPLIAQHPVIHATPPAVGPAPTYHVPIYRAPVYQYPISRMPVYGPNSFSRIPNASSRTTGTLLFHHPIPAVPLPLRDRFSVFPVFANPFWTYNFCWWGICDQYWTSVFIYDVVPARWDPPIYTLSAAPAPVYVYGAEREDFPQLVLNDGTILNVTDYWLSDNQLHFKLIDGEATTPSEDTIPFEQLDLQKTIDVNSGRGFRFVLRNQPFEQYVRDHPDGPILSSPQ